jgi:protein-L-isoaspartate(D-aspartate) O-methyltransferase
MIRALTHDVGKARPEPRQHKPRQHEPRQHEPWQRAATLARWGMGLDEAARRRVRLATELRRQGVRDERVLAAIAEVPRHRFIDGVRLATAYANRPVPIGMGQTISQPYVVALMAEAVSPGPSDRVLEVGTGSGYGAAVLARLARKVVTVERLPALASSARLHLAAAGIDNVEVVEGDGTTGWPDGAPWDAVVVTAGGPSVPQQLVDQLADGGRLVIPVGDIRHQQLVRVRLTASGPVHEDLGPVAFVPLIGNAGW